MELYHIKAIAFDADDTLWVNEPLFRQAEARFCELLAPYADPEDCNRELFAYEMQNLPLYGYGIKPFVLSLIEAAMRISDDKIPLKVVEQLIDMGKEMLEAPVEVLDGIEDTLEGLAGKYRLIMATKGDLLDQQRKLIKSGLEPFFHHIEIVSDKTQKEYIKLVKHLDVRNKDFLMVGNSVKSDILPVLEIGSYAIHIPFHTTWEHEVVAEPVEHPHFKELFQATELLQYL